MFFISFLLFFISMPMIYASCRMCVASTITENCGPCGACAAWTNFSSNACGVTQQRRNCPNECGARVESQTRTCTRSCGPCTCGTITCHQHCIWGTRCVDERRTCANHAHCGNSRVERRTRTCQNSTTCNAWSAWTTTSGSCVANAAAPHCGPCTCGPGTCSDFNHVNFCVREIRTCSNNAACGNPQSRVENRTRICSSTQCWAWGEWGGPGTCTNNAPGGICTCTAWSAISVVTACPTGQTITNPAIEAGDCNAADAILRLDECNAGETMIVGCDNRGGSGSSVRGIFTRYCQTPGHPEVRCD